MYIIELIKDNTTNNRPYKCIMCVLFINQHPDYILTRKPALAILQQVDIALNDKVRGYEVILHKGGLA